MSNPKNSPVKWKVSPFAVAVTQNQINAPQTCQVSRFYCEIHGFDQNLAISRSGTKSSRKTDILEKIFLST